MRCLYVCGLLGVGVAMCVATPRASGQSPIQWIDSLEEGRNVAQRTQRPLLLYMPGGGDAEECDVEDAQDKSFRDATVRSFVQQRYVPVRLTRSRAHQRMLSEVGLPADVGLFLVAATPDGELIGRVDPTIVADAPRLLDGLVRLFRQYRRDLFSEALKPELTGDKLNTGNVRQALGVIQRFLIAQADESVAKLLKRPDLADRLRQEVYETLSTLSTKASVEALVRAAEDDDDAREALDDCTPAGAEHMLNLLVTSEGRVRHYVYEAIADIGDFDDPKMRVFWENADDEQRKAALKKIRQRVRNHARGWRSQYADVR